MTGDQIVAELSLIAKTAIDAARAIASSGLDLSADFALAQDAMAILTQAGPVLQTINTQVFTIEPGYGANEGVQSLGKIGAGR